MGHARWRGSTPVALVLLTLRAPHKREDGRGPYQIGRMVVAGS